MAISRRLAALVGSSPDAPDTSYRLHRDEYIPDGVRRVVHGQLTEAHDTLAKASKRSLDDAVHEVRKHLKRLRTTLRLVRGAVTDDTYDRERAAYRDAARRLAASRDARVRLQTLDELSERFAGELEPSVTARLRTRLADEHERAVSALREDDADVRAVLAALEDSAARTPTWRLDADGIDALAPGCKRIYRQGRKRMRAARADPSVATFHDWRKRVKDLRYATQLVREARPNRLKRLGGALHELSDLLGEDHDLAVLRDYAEAHPRCFDDAASRAAFVSVVERRSAALRERSLDLGARVYRRSPKRFVRDIERGWRTHAADDTRRVAG